MLRFYEWTLWTADFDHMLLTETLKEASTDVFFPQLFHIQWIFAEEIKHEENIDILVPQKHLMKRVLFSSAYS